MAEPRLILYNGKQYDLDLLRDTVLNNYNTYARQFGYGKDKFQKDYIGLTQLLRELENGNAGIETGRITFKNNFGFERGDFGKARNKSKHYTNPAWMILDTIQKMNAYDSNAGKKKLNKSVLNQELSTEIGDISTLTPEYKLKVQKDAVNKLLAKYSNIGDNYVLDDDFDMNEYLGRLVELNKALETSTIDDDNYVFNRLGITNTNTKQEEAKELIGIDKIASDIMKSGLYSEAEARAEAELLLPEYKRKFLENYKKSLGILEESTSGSSQVQSAQNSGQSNGQGTNRNSGQGSDQNSNQGSGQGSAQNGGNGNQQGNDDNNDGSKNTPKQKFVEWTKSNEIKEGDMWNYNGKTYKMINGVAVQQKSHKRGPRELTDMPIAKNGMKLNYIRNIKKYQEGTTEDGINLYDPSSEQIAAIVGALGFIPGGVGRVARVGYPLYDSYTTLHDYNEGSIQRDQAITQLIQNAVNLGFGAKSYSKRRNTAGRKEYADKIKAHKQTYTDEAKAQSKQTVDDLRQKEDALKQKIESPEYKAILAKEEAAAREGKTAKLSRTEKSLKQSVEQEKANIEQYKTDNESALKYNDNESASKRDLQSTYDKISASEKETWTPSGQQLAGGLAINGAAGLYNGLISGNDLSFNDYMRMASPLASRFGVKGGYNWLKGEKLPTVESALGEGATETAAGKGNWFTKLFKRGNSSGTAAMIAGSAALGLAPQSAQGMNDMYSMRAGDPVVEIDPSTGRPVVTGIFQGFQNIGGTTYGINQYGFPISSNLQNVDVYGSMPDWMKRAGVTTNEEGKSVIPMQNAQMIMENPELRAKVIMSGIPFSNTTGSNGEIRAHDSSLNNGLLNYIAGLNAAKRGETTDLRYTLPYIVGTAGAITLGGEALANPTVSRRLGYLWKGLTDPRAIAAEGLSAQGIRTLYK